MADVPEFPGRAPAHVPVHIPVTPGGAVLTDEVNQGSGIGIGSGDAGGDGSASGDGNGDDLSSAVAAARFALDSLIEGGATVAVSGLTDADLLALDRSLRLLEAAVGVSASRSRSHQHPNAHRHPHSRRSGPLGGGVLLNDLDARILEGVAVGVSSVQLAARLYLSRQGVEYHIGSMLRRFRVPNRTALACKAFSMGVFGGGAWPPKVRPEFIIAE